MADQQTTVPGAHYSGSNKIPTINKFLENLDRDKKHRDAEIEKQKSIAEHEKSGSTTSSPEVTPHKNALPQKKGQKTVTDPVTGKEVTIEDADRRNLDLVDNPIVYQANFIDATMHANLFSSPSLMPTWEKPPSDKSRNCKAPC